MSPNSSPQHPRSPEDVQRDLRQLELVDRIMGLEAENARLAALLITPAGPQFGYQRMLTDLMASRTWRVGRVALAPVRAVRSVRERLKKNPA